VKRAVVTLEEHKAVVIYDPRQATVQKLIDVVNQAEAPLAGIQYSASIKPAGP
jgi:hypothetical protein